MARNPVFLLRKELVLFSGRPDDECDNLSVHLQA